MGLFRYEAVDESGRVFHGAMNARDEQEVAQNLAGMGYTLRAVHTRAGVQPAKGAVGTAPQPQTSAQPAGVRPAGAASGVPVSVKSIVPARTLASFFRQLVTMVKSGIPLYQSFSDIIPYVRDRRLRRVLPHIQQALQSGQKLSGAMALFPNIFPVHTTASIWAGELSGKLEIALNEVAADLEQEAADTLYGRIGWGIAKANIIGGIIVIPMCGFMRLFAGFTQMDPSQIVPTIIQFFVHSLARSTPFVIAVVLSWIIWGYIKRIPSVKRLLDSLLLRTPIWGTLHQCRGLTRFLHVLDELYSAGISVDTAWDAASLTPRNAVLAEKLRLTRANSPQAVGVTNLVTASGAFEMESIGIVSAGEKSGQVPEALSNLSRIYEEKANARRTVGRMASISANITSSLIIYGIAAIMLEAGYVGSLYQLMEP